MVYESKGIEIQHFDTKSGKELDIQETFQNTVAEYLFPDTTFSIGTVYDKTTPEELRSQGDRSLEFANGDKFYFANHPVREQLFPTPSDGAAYGSLPFTQCQQFTEAQDVRVLVIDHETGENNVGLDPEAAKKLVGDCWCRIDPALHEQVGGKENTPFQFRMGIRPQADSPVARIAKGTMCPTDLSEVGSGYDLILATSAFKGRKGESAISPGEYNLTLGIGIKSHAYYGTHSLGPQFLVNFPSGVREDILPQQQRRRQELESLAQDPLALAADYLTYTQERYKYQVLDSLEIEENKLSAQDLEALMDLVEEKNHEVLYHLLGTDSTSHRQLLEHPKVTTALNDHLQTQYREVATGRSVKFKAGLLQPGHDLLDHEICDPNLPDGVEVIASRSPVPNSNSVLVLTNRHIQELMHTQGSVWLHPDTAKQLQGDFDGDRVFYERAENYPHLALEVKEKQQPENRYADIAKPSKIIYTGSFEEIALSCKDNQVGKIANRLMGAIALEQEINLLPENEREAYIQAVSDYYQSLWQTNEAGERFLPDYLEGQEVTINELARLAQDPRSSEEKLARLAQHLHESGGELGQQLQIAVDGFKSALRPDGDVLAAAQALTGYQEVGWLKDYKAKETYRDRPLTSTNYSPVDLMVQPVNEVWQQNFLSPRPNHQFQALFEGVKVTETEIKWAEQVEAESNRLNSYAFRLKDEYQNAPGPRLMLSSSTGRQLHVIHTLESNHPQTYTLDSMNIRVRHNQGEKRLHPPLKYMVVAEVPGESNEKGKPLYKRIGYLSKISEREHAPMLEHLIEKSGKGYAELGRLQVDVSPGLTPTQISAAFGQVRTFSETQYREIPNHQKLNRAAALWQVCHRRTNDKDHAYSKASAVFALFPDEIGSQLEQLHLRQVKVSGLLTPANEHGERFFKGEKLPVYIGIESNPHHPYYNRRSVSVEGKLLGYLSETSPQLPIDTFATATIGTEPGSGVTATLPDGTSFRIGVLKNYADAETNFQNLSGTLEVTFIQKPGRKNPVPAVRYNGQLLGEINDKDSQTLLKEKSLLESGALIEATLNREPASVAWVTVDPDTVSYSERFSQNKHFLPQLEGEPQLRETLWATEDYKWEVSPGQFEEKPTLRLAVDHRKNSELKQFLNKHGVPFTTAYEHDDVGAEYSLGYVVVRIEREQMPPSVYQTLQRKFGDPLNAHHKGSYFQKLEDIAKRPVSVKQGTQKLETLGIASPETITQIQQQESLISISEQQRQPLNAPSFVQTIKTNPLANLHLFNQQEAMTLQPEIHIPVITRAKLLDEYQKQKRSFEFDDFAEALWNRAKEPEPGELDSLGKNFFCAISDEEPDPYNSEALIEESRLIAQYKDSIYLLGQKIFSYEDVATFWVVERFDVSNQQEAIHEFCQRYGSGLHNDATQGNELPTQPTNPLADLQPLNQAVATHMNKDLAMAEVATQFIGSSAASPATPSSTRNYEQAWGNRANTGTYTTDDTIMVSGSGPWRGVTLEQIQATFETHYKPLLDKAIASGSQFVVGNAQGSDQLVQGYLQEKNYHLTQTDRGYLEAKPQLLKSTTSQVSQDNIMQHQVSSVNEPPTKLTLYTNGTCSGDPSPGGWGHIVASEDKVIEEGFGSKLQTTSNRIEIQAVIEGLKAVQAIAPQAPVTVISDSEYVVKTMTKDWQRRANQDLWQQLDEAIGARAVTFEWAKGSDPLSERAAQLACQGTAQAQQSFAQAQSLSEGTSLKLYADGKGCDGCGDWLAGEWSYRIEHSKGQVIEAQGNEPKTYQHRMEVTAILEGLQSAREQFPNAHITVIAAPNHTHQAEKTHIFRIDADLWAKIHSLAAQFPAPITWQERSQNEQANQFSEQKPLALREPFSKENPTSTSPSSFELIDNLPLSQEYMAEHIELQQQRTEQVAPVVAALLKAKQLTQPNKIEQDPSTGALFYQGEKDTISWDGKRLDLLDNASGQPKMSAIAHKNENTGEISWQSMNLPHGSPGLSDADIKKFTDPQLNHLIKQKIFEHTHRRKEDKVVALRRS